MVVIIVLALVSFPVLATRHGRPAGPMQHSPGLYSGPKPQNASVLSIAPTQPHAPATYPQRQGFGQPLPTPIVGSDGRLPSPQQGLKALKLAASEMSAAQGPKGMNLIQSFDGIPYDSWSPPDVQVAVGPNHVMEMVNNEAEIWTKQGNTITSFSTESLFQVGTDFIADPRVLYDPQNQTWFATEFHTFTGGADVRLAVSVTSDPTQNWRVYSLPAATSCPDQPILGLSEKQVVISANDYVTCRGSYSGVQYWVINKNNLVTGSTISYQTFGPDASLFSVHPVLSLNSASEFMVSASFYSSGQLKLLQVQGVPPEPVTISQFALPVSSYNLPPNAPQLGTSNLVNTNDGRVLDALWSQNKLWLSLNSGCVPPGDSQIRSCVHLTQVDTSTMSVLQDFDFGQSGQYYFYPALRTDGSDDLILIFGYSSASEYPGLMTTERLATDPPNTLEAPTLLQQGTGPETSSCTSGVCRYGDYFGSALDPSDHTLVWLAGEYGGSSFWRTRIAEASATPCGSFPIPIPADHLICTGAGPTTISLNWGQSGYLFFNRYELQQSASGSSGPWTTIDKITSKSNTTDYVRNLSPSATYWWRIVDYDCCGATATSNVLQITQPASANLTFTKPTETTVRFVWNNLATYGGLVAFESYQLMESINGGSYSLAQAIYVNSTRSWTTNLSPGDYGFYLITTDKCGSCSTPGLSSSNSNTLNIIIPLPPSALASAQPATVDIGQVVSLTCSAAGGVPPYTYSWDFGDGFVGSGQTVTHVYSSPGMMNPACTVIDYEGAVAKSSTSVIVSSDPSVTTPIGQPVSADVGQTVVFTTQVIGGSGGYTYSWLGLPTGCSSANTAVISCIPTGTGTFTIKVAVTDSNGFPATSSGLQFTVSSPPNIVAFTASPTRLDIGQTVTFVVSAMGGTGTLSYSYSGLPPGCATTDTTTISCAPTSTGAYSTSVHVTDSNGFTVTSNPLSVTVNPDPVVNSFTTSPAIIDLSQEATFTVSASQGTGMLSYSYAGLPPGCSTSNAPILTCTPSTGGSYTITTTVVDEAGKTATASATMTVNSDPAILTFTSSSQTVDVGEEVSITVAAGGGTGKFSYSYSGLPVGCATIDAPIVTCAPSSAGTYAITLTLTDSTGFTTTSSPISITVNADPTIASFTVSLASIDLGQSTVLAVSAQGGTGQLSYAYSGLPPGCVSTNTASLTCTPSSSGTYTIEVTVTDQAGRSTTSSVNLDVGPARVIGLPSTEGYAVTGGVIIAAIALIVLAVVLTRRGNRPAQDSKSGPSTNPSGQ